MSRIDYRWHAKTNAFVSHECACSCPSSFRAHPHTLSDLCTVDVKRHWLFAEPPAAQPDPTILQALQGVLHRGTAELVVALHLFGAHVVEEPPSEGHLRRQGLTTHDELESRRPTHLHTGSNRE